MPLLPGPHWKSREISRELWSRFPWVTTTPRGVLVEPDVYCSMEGRAGSGATTGWPAGLRRAASAGWASTASQTRPGSVGPARFIRSRTAVVVRTADGFASSAIDLNLLSGRAARWG